MGSGSCQRYYRGSAQGRLPFRRTLYKHFMNIYECLNEYFSENLHEHPDEIDKHFHKYSYEHLCEH